MKVNEHMNKIQITDLTQASDITKIQPDAELIDFTSVDYDKEISDYLIADIITEQVITDYTSRIENSQKHYHLQVIKHHSTYSPLQLFEYADGSGSLLPLPEPEQLIIIRSISQHFVVAEWQGKNKIYHWTDFISG
jgi:hypothetical protein